MFIFTVIMSRERFRIERMKPMMPCPGSSRIVVPIKAYRRRTGQSFEFYGDGNYITAIHHRQIRNTSLGVSFFELDRGRAIAAVSDSHRLMHSSEVIAFDYHLTDRLRTWKVIRCQTGVIVNWRNSALSKSLTDSFKPNKRFIHDSSVVNVCFAKA